MEENKMVEKSGLPVVINGVELTEKDLRCIAMHLKFLYSVIYSQDLCNCKSTFACQLCYDAGPNEKCCPMQDYDFPYIMPKLEKITGITL